jgi:hypothetical protein
VAALLRGLEQLRKAHGLRFLVRLELRLGGDAWGGWGVGGQKPTNRERGKPGR